MPLLQTLESISFKEFMIYGGYAILNLIKSYVCIHFISISLMYLNEGVIFLLVTGEIILAF